MIIDRFVRRIFYANYLHSSDIDERGSFYFTRRANPMYKSWFAPPLITAWNDNLFQLSEILFAPFPFKNCMDLLCQLPSFVRQRRKKFILLHKAFWRSVYKSWFAVPLTAWKTLFEFSEILFAPFPFWHLHWSSMPITFICHTTTKKVQFGVPLMSLYYCQQFLYPCLRRLKAAGDPCLRPLDATGRNSTEARFWSFHCYRSGARCHVSRSTITALATT